MCVCMHVCVHVCVCVYVRVCGGKESGEEYSMHVCEHGVHSLT